MKEQQELKDSEIEFVGKIPTDWKVLPLKFFSSITLGKMLTPEDKGGNIKKQYLRSQNIQINSVDTDDIKEMWFSDSDLTKYRLNSGDILVNEGGDIGRTCMWNDELEECYIQNSVNRVTILSGHNKYYLFHFYLYHQTGYFDSLVNRVSIPHLTKEKLEI
jgi:type I restriction enzyme S subunit